jgi:ActR/RegA family two-component response regulator
MKKKVLFVDDEAGIRLTLPLILTKAGFDVSVASTVPEALNAIQNTQFDILLSDLNIGQPGDGFTVVSAMRRTQPKASTFILTGYPDFESALIAIRNQVDDYLTKPVEIEKLVQILHEQPVANRRVERSVPCKRISTIIRENRDEIIQRWLDRVTANPHLSQVSIPVREKVDHLPGFIREIADRIERHPDDASEMAVEAAIKHGEIRYSQGYTVPMLLVEAAILDKAIAGLLQEHLLAIDISTLIPDMNQMSEALNCAVETSVRAFLEVSP